MAETLPIKGMAFPIKIGPLGHFEGLSGSAKLKSNIKAIVMTALGDRLMRPRFGNLGFAYVFRNVDSATCTLLETATAEAIARHEPRVTVVGVSCSQGIEYGWIRTHVQYRINASGVFEQLETQIPGA